MIVFKLREFLNDRMITQIELSKQTGIRPPTISAICNNSLKELPISVMDRICTALQCEPGEWIEYQKNK